MQSQRPYGLALTVFGAAFLGMGCSTHSSVSPLAGLASQASARLSEPTRLHVGAAFGPDGKLWRVIPSETHVFVDHSDDFGKTYTSRIALNRADQKIRSQEEDRPRIAIGRNGVIAVSYSADADQPWTTFLSVSRDSGASFSEPIPLSASAKTAKAYQAVLGVNPQGAIWAFWHDERESREDVAGNAIYGTQVANEVPLEHKVAGGLCECCRIAVDFDAAGLPVLAARFIYPGQIRDHGLLVPENQSLRKWQTWRATQDEWQIQACPEHGPSLSIASDGVSHLAWFTQGKQRQGIFYAHSHDGGRKFGTPLPIGSPSRLAGHPDLVAVGSDVDLVWREYDGEVSYAMHAHSSDGGHSFGAPRTAAESRSEADVPLLLKYQDRVYLAWNSVAEGFRLIALSANH